MSRAIQKADWFISDFELQYGWCVHEAGLSIAIAYLHGLNETLELLAVFPELGRVRRFRHPKLRGLRSFRVNPPFHKHLIFYPHDTATLFVERVVHGARDLPRRLTEAPEYE